MSNCKITVIVGWPPKCHSKEFEGVFLNSHLVCHWWLDVECHRGAEGLKEKYYNKQNVKWIELNEWPKSDSYYKNMEQGDIISNDELIFFIKHIWNRIQSIKYVSRKMCLSFIVSKQIEDRIRLILETDANKKLVFDYKYFNMWPHPSLALSFTPKEAKWRYT